MSYNNNSNLYSNYPPPPSNGGWGAAPPPPPPPAAPMPFQGFGTMEMNYPLNNNTQPAGVAVMGSPMMMMAGTNNNNIYPAAVQCNLTQLTLNQYLRESNHGQNVGIFNCYFVPASMPPRCVACSRLIAEHATAGAVGGAIPFGGVYPTETMRTGEGERPDIAKNGNIETYANRGLLIFRIIGCVFLLVSIILFAVFGSQIASKSSDDPYAAPLATKFITPSILLFMGFIFTIITKSTTITFNRDTRTATFNSNRFPWFCFSSSGSVMFSEIYSVEERQTNTRINNVPQSDIILKTRNASCAEIDLGMVSSFSSSLKVQGWRSYLREIGCAV